MCDDSHFVLFFILNLCISFFFFYSVIIGAGVYKNTDWLFSEAALGGSHMLRVWKQKQQIVAHSTFNQRLE